MRLWTRCCQSTDPRSPSSVASIGRMTKDYSPPTITKIGSLHDLTLRGKDFGAPNDGDFFRGKGLTTVS